MQNKYNALILFINQYKNHKNNYQCCIKRVYYKPDIDPDKLQLEWL